MVVLLLIVQLVWLRTLAQCKDTRVKILCSHVHIGDPSCSVCRGAVFFFILNVITLLCYQLKMGNKAM